MKIRALGSIPQNDAALSGWAYWGSEMTAVASAERWAIETPSGLVPATRSGVSGAPTGRSAF
jgi:hypothetical protein